MSDYLIFTDISGVIFVGNNETSFGNAIKPGVEIPTTVVIPSHYENKPVEVIGQYAFHQCQMIQEVKIYAPINRIEFYAFHGCSALKKINIPNTCTYLGQSAMDGRIDDIKASGPLTVLIEPNSTLGELRHAAFCNYGIMRIYIYDKIFPIHTKDSIAGFNDLRIYSPFLFNFCERKTTLIGDCSCLVKKNTIFYKQYVFLCICALEI